MNRSKGSLPGEGLAFLMVWGTPNHAEKARGLFAGPEGEGRSVSIGYGDGWCLFLHSTHPDFAENASAIVLTIGPVRDASSGDVLGAEDLLLRKLAGPDSLAPAQLMGNGLIISISKNEPQACLFRSLVGTHALYYHEAGDLFACSDDIRMLFPFLPSLELDPEALIPHMLFRSACGNRTYLKSVKRLEHGHSLFWKDGKIRSNLVQIVESSVEPVCSELSDLQVAAFARQSAQIIGSYLRWLLAQDRETATLLSGGIDSGLMQHWINQQRMGSPQHRSLAYRIMAPEFDYEARYAMEASQVLGTLHDSVRIGQKDYPELLLRSVEIAAAPIGHEWMPCHLALAEVLSERHSRISHVFMGVAGDALHGGIRAKRLLQLMRISRIPMAVELLEGLVMLIRPVLPNKAYGSRELAQWLIGTKDPCSPQNPWNAAGLFSDFSMVMKCFGERSTCRAFQERKDQGARYLKVKTQIEAMHSLVLVTSLPEDLSIIERLYQGFRLQVLCPYLDREFILRMFSISPRIRYYAGGRAKPIFKRILENQTGYLNVNKPKGHSGFVKTLFGWMREGPLREMVQSIERPSFMSKEDFKRKLDDPDWFTWNLLTLDLFKRQVL